MTHITLSNNFNILHIPEDTCICSDAKNATVSTRQNFTVTIVCMPALRRTLIHYRAKLEY